MKRQPRALSPARVAWALAGILVLGFCIGPPIKSAATPDGPRNDFISFYSAGQLAGSPDLYDRQQITARHRAVGFGHGPGQYSFPYVRLPFCAALLWPASWMPFGAAFWFWEATIVTSFGFAAFLWRQFAPGAVLVAATWNAGLASAMLTGQDAPMVFCVLSIAVWSLHKRPRTAGFLFSLCLIKWHLFLFLPLFVIARREWRFAGAFAAGAAGLLAWSTWLNPEWIRIYYAVITASDVTLHQAIMPSIYGLARGSLWIAVPGALVIAVASWKAMRRAPDSRAAVAVLFLAGVLASPHVYPADCVLLLPASLLACRPEFTAAVRVLGWATPVLPALLVIPGLPFIAQTALLALFAGIALSWTVPYLARRQTVAMSAA